MYEFNGGHSLSMGGIGNVQPLGEIKSKEGFYVINPVDVFYEDLKEGKLLVVLPISRSVIENQFNIGNFYFYPSGQVEISKFRIVPNKKLEHFEGQVIELEGQALREVSTSITGVDEEVFKNNTLVAFTIDLDWNGFLLATHEYDLKLIAKLSREAEKVMDLIKFNFCKFGLIDTLPGQVGTWDGADSFSTALLYNLEDNESYVVAGAVISHAVVKGIGLKLNDNETYSLSDDYSEFIYQSNEVGSIN